MLFPYISEQAKSDTVDVVCEAKDVQMGLPESPPVATASNSTVPQPDISVEVFQTEKC